VCEVQSLAGWQLEVWDATTAICRYVYERDNMSGPLKLIWLDQMTNGLGSSLCTAFPMTGTVRLFNDQVAHPTEAPTATGTPAAPTVTPTGTPPTPTPTTVVHGTPMATRVYPGATPGISYAAQDWQAPEGSWGFGTPNPGR
jgi:hypothetical protein